MSDETNTGSEGSDSEPKVGSPRRPYQAPRLKQYGKLRELTTGASVANKPEQHIHQTNKHRV